MLARRIASRNSGSSAASIVICVKKTVSGGRRSSPSISSNRSARVAVSCSRLLLSWRRDAIRRSFKRDRVEIVIGESDEPEATAPQLHDLIEDAIHASLSRALSVRAPDRAERAVLRTATHRLHGGPHVARLRQQIPATRQKRVGLDPTAVVESLGDARHAVAKHDRPDAFAVAGHDRMGAAEVVCLVRIEGRVNPSVHDVGASGARG